MQLLHRLDERGDKAVVLQRIKILRMLRFNQARKLGISLFHLLGNEADPGVCTAFELVLHRPELPDKRQAARTVGDVRFQSPV